jgi:hypothetical protein
MNDMVVVVNPKAGGLSYNLALLSIVDHDKGARSPPLRAIGLHVDCCSAPTSSGERANEERPMQTTRL